MTSDFPVIDLGAVREPQERLNAVRQGPAVRRSPPHEGPKGQAAYATNATTIAVAPSQLPDARETRYSLCAPSAGADRGIVILWRAAAPSVSHN